MCVEWWSTACLDVLARLQVPQVLQKQLIVCQTRVCSTASLSTNARLACLPHSRYALIGSSAQTELSLTIKVPINQAAGIIVVIQR